MIDYLTHYYKRESQPFSSLSALPEEEAIRQIKEMHKEDEVWGRFKNPSGYLKARKKVENWVREAFIEKGGLPESDYPVYMMLGQCKTIEEAMEKEGLSKIQIPLSVLDEDDVSFTFVDSMFSYEVRNQRPFEDEEDNYLGKVLTMYEVRQLMEDQTKDGQVWNKHLPKDIVLYIEAQVWNIEKLKAYLHLSKS